MSEPEPGKSPDNPWPVRAVATRIAKYIDRLGTVWIEGQLTELKLRQTTAWMVLRDPAADMSLTVSCPRDLVANAPVPLSEGAQVIMLRQAAVLHPQRLIQLADQRDPRGGHR